MWRHLGKPSLCTPTPRSRTLTTLKRPQVVFSENIKYCEILIDCEKFPCLAHEKERWSLRRFVSGVGWSVPMQSFTCSTFQSIQPCLLKFKYQGWIEPPLVFEFGKYTNCHITLIQMINYGENQQIAKLTLRIIFADKLCTNSRPHLIPSR